jgi:dTDP-4-dehydrorhamnose reductase
LRIGDDQIGKPTWSRAVAEATSQILARVAPRGEAMVDGIADASGTYHMCCEDPTSWFGFAKEILQKYPPSIEDGGARPPRTTRLIPISSAEYPTPAKRPHYSVLSPRKIVDAFHVVIPSWREQLELVLQELHT